MKKKVEEEVGGGKRRRRRKKKTPTTTTTATRIARTKTNTRKKKLMWGSMWPERLEYFPLGLYRKCLLTLATEHRDLITGWGRSHQDFSISSQYNAQKPKWNANTRIRADHPHDHGDKENRKSSCALEAFPHKSMTINKAYPGCRYGPGKEKDGRPTQREEIAVTGVWAEYHMKLS